MHEYFYPMMSSMTGTEWFLMSFILVILVWLTLYFGIVGWQVSKIHGLQEQISKMCTDNGYQHDCRCKTYQTQNRQPFQSDLTSDVAHEKD